MPKSAKREATGSQKEGRTKSLFYLASRQNQEFRGQNLPKKAKRDAKGSPGGAPIGSKSIKKSKLFLESVLNAKKGRRIKVLVPIVAPFGSMLAARFHDFSCYFLAMLFIDL